MPKKKQVVHAEKEKREQNSALRSYLKDCGVRTINAGTEIKLNPKFFPALSYSKPRDCFVIYFQSPHRFGEQSFFFDQISSFCDRADENATDLAEASSSLCFSSAPEDLDNAPAQVQRDFCLAVIKRFFSATTPTALNAAKRQNKKRRRRLLLKPKLATIKAALGCPRINSADTTMANGSDSRGCCVDIGNENGTAGGASANNGNGTATATISSSLTTSPRRSQLQLPDFAEPFIQKAAREFNLNWFNAFWEQYVAQKGRKAVKRREREKLEELFKDRVSRLQEAKEGV